ncbi:hypothetical protein M15_05710 [Atrimonas thermophila]
MISFPGAVPSLMCQESKRNLQIEEFSFPLDKSGNKSYYFHKVMLYYQNMIKEDRPCKVLMN